MAVDVDGKVAAVAKFLEVDFAVDVDAEVPAVTEFPEVDFSVDVDVNVDDEVPASTLAGGCDSDRLEFTSGVGESDLLELSAGPWV